MDDERVVRDTFDKMYGTLDGLPNVIKSRPSTVTSVMPLIGKSQTFVVQTLKTEDGNFLFVQLVDAEGRARIVIPPKVAAAIYRQRESLVTRVRKQAGRDRWDNLTEDEKTQKVHNLRGPRRVANDRDR